MEIVKIPGDIMPDLSGESWIWGKFDGTSLAGGKGSDKDLQNHHHHNHQDHHQDPHQHLHQPHIISIISITLTNITISFVSKVDLVSSSDRVTSFKSLQHQIVSY